MAKINIITVYNNVQLMNQMEQSVLKQMQNADFEYQIIAIDNTRQQYSSASKAYNYAIDCLVDGDIYVFCHQDIVFLEDSLQTIYSLCTEKPNTLFGAAGVRNERNSQEGRIISAMSVIQRDWKYTTLASGTTESVFTLDECLIAGDAAIFKALRFDEETCDGWHLYAVEFSLRCHVEGIDVRVYDSKVIHLSGGKLDRSFFDCEAKLARKYRSHFPVISYPCSWTFTSPVLYFILRLYRKIRYAT